MTVAETGKFLVRIDDEFLAEIDEVARLQYFDARTELIRQAVREYVFTFAKEDRAKTSQALAELARSGRSTKRNRKNSQAVSARR
ncbi:MAG: ribbon-helix-helix domain-containing protein [Ktedonobacteraceae bacterium]